jgi:hypothetical protein
MRKINAYVGECLPENVGVIIDDYPNPEGNAELAINLDLGDCLLNFYRDIKEDGSVEYVVINVDKNSKKLTRYVATETNQTIVSTGLIEGLNSTFNRIQVEAERVAC